MLLQLYWWIKDLFCGKPLGGSLRSPRWREVRNTHIKNNPLCIVCGRKGTLLRPNEAHHIIPFTQNPALELDPQNLVTVCREDHLIFAHLRSFKSWNKDIVSDAKIWYNKFITRP